MEYTKGEWQVRSGFKVTCGEEQIWIADCYPFNEKQPRPRIIEAENNARLMAAAPDMYEALKECRDYLRFNKGNASPIFDKANQALAKAEGK